MRRSFLRACVGCAAAASSGGSALSALAAQARAVSSAAPAAGRIDPAFALADVRLLPGPFLDAQQTDRAYILALDPDRLLAPFRREAGLAQPKPSYGNWESSGLDGHMGGHYLSALAMMAASTGDEAIRHRLSAFLSALRACQLANRDGYLGGIPDGRTAWRDVARGALKVDSFSVNGRWVPWYNLHKTFAGLRDAWLIGGEPLARTMLLDLCDWAQRLLAPLSDVQMQDMMRAEHGGMNEVFADVARMTGDARYLRLAERFSHRAILDPLREGRDALTGLHANTQIPKVIGFARIAEARGQDAGADAEAEWLAPARTFWKTVRERRSVAIGGNSVKEHFHPLTDFQPMLDEVEGPETCNTYNMLKLTEILHAHSRDDSERAAYADYHERALFNHILASQHPGGGFVYFTPMRPQHYRVYSQVHEGMWCCVGSGLESHARHGQFIYTRRRHRDDALPTIHVNLFIASKLTWDDEGIELTQRTRFPDEPRTQIRIDRGGRFTLKIRHPGWVAAGALRVRINGQPSSIHSTPGSYIALTREWTADDLVDVRLPMRTTLEALPGRADFFAVLHGPIVLAAKAHPLDGERLDTRAGGARMDHIAQGPRVPLAASPQFVSASADFGGRLVPVAGQSLTFAAGSLLRGDHASSLRLMPFFRLHDARYVLYWPWSTPQDSDKRRDALARDEQDRMALQARTVDAVAPGEQQPESDHGFDGEGVDTGLHEGRRWRHATAWFGYRLNDPRREGRVLRLAFSAADDGRRFTLWANERPLRTFTLKAPAGTRPDAPYEWDVELPEDLPRPSDGSVRLRLVAEPGSIAGGLYGLWLLRGETPALSR